MDRFVTHDEESRLSEFFRPLNPPLADDGFSGIVLRRIRRRRRLRGSILGAAAVIGGVLAFGPFYELAVLLSEGLVVAATRWSDAGWLAQNQVIVVVALLALVLPGAIRLLER